MEPKAIGWFQIVQTQRNRFQVKTLSHLNYYRNYPLRTLLSRTGKSGIKAIVSHVKQALAV